VKIGKVVGSVVSTINVPEVDGRKLLLCDVLSIDGKATGEYLLAVDTIGAGASEKVLLIDEGNSARQVLDLEDAPIRAAIVGIIDDPR
jgi:microcompartment protein CcmK/EutM